MRWLDSVPWTVAILAAVTLGLAPFTPEPHVWEKLRMLVSGELARGIDWADLAMHGAPWVLVILKAFRESSKVRRS